MTNPEDLVALLTPFGVIESSEIAILLKPPPPKKAKRGTALVPFKQVGDAFAAVCSSGSSARGLQDIEISWAEGKEPALISWLKKTGKLGGEAKAKPRDGPSTQLPPFPSSRPAEPHSTETSTTPFSTFPSTFVSITL